MTEEGANTPHLSVGLLLEDKSLPRAKLLGLQRLLEEHPVEITFIAINEEKSRAETTHTDADDSRLFHRVRKLIADVRAGEIFSIVTADNHIARMLGEPAPREMHETWRRVPIADFIDKLDAEERSYSPEKIEDGVGYTAPDDIVDAFASKTDLILNFEHNVLKGDILEATEYGVLSPHAGDVRRYRGRPPKVWQFLNGEDEIGRTLQILTPDLDGGKPVLIEHSPIRDDATFWDLAVQQHRIMPDMYPKAIERLLDPDFEVTAPDELGELTYAKSKHQWSVVARMLYKNWRARLLRLVYSRSLHPLKGPSYDSPDETVPDP